MAVGILAHACSALGIECVGIPPVRLSPKIAGQVFDPSGQPVALAKVTVLGEARSLDTGTDEHGFFQGSGVAARYGRVEVYLPGFQFVEIPFEVDSGAPFLLLAIRLEPSMSCDTRVCTVLRAAPAPLFRAPSCLDEPWWAPARRKVDATLRRLDEAAASCAGGDQATCRRLARVAGRDTSREKRQHAVRALSDQVLLVGLARNAADDSVREIATAKLTDQTVLAALASGDKSERVRAVATARLEDPSLLARLAGDPSAQVRAAAAGSPNLVEESALATLATKDPSEEVRRTALGNLNLVDQRLLVRVASGGDPPWVRMAAVARLADADLLRRLALSDDDARVRTVALSNPALNDDSLFEAVAKADVDAAVRASALGRFGDPLVRDRVAVYVTNEAVAGTNDQRRIVDAAAISKAADVRAAAAQRITTEADLVQLLRREKDEVVRVRAVANPALEDQALLAELAAHDPSPRIRVLAAGRLDDHALAQRVYAELAEARDSVPWRRFPDFFVKWEAISRVEDQQVLARVAQGDGDEQRRGLAVARLEDQAVLARIATSDVSFQVRALAASRLSDTALLARIGKEDADWSVRQAAAARLKELRRR